MQGTQTLAVFCRTLIVFIAIAVSCGPQKVLGTSFHNLDFESAVIGSVPLYSQLPASQATPYWANNTGYLPYDTIALDAPCVSIHDGHGSANLGDFNPLQGLYSVMLQDGLTGDGHTPISTWISQTGDIPSWAKSLMFGSDMSDYINELQVSINGAVVPFTLYSVGGTVNSSWGPVKTYACDISAFAGDTDVTLKFEKLVHDPIHIYNHGFVPCVLLALQCRKG